MKKIILALVAFLYSFYGYSQFPEGFEGSATTLPANWSEYHSGSGGSQIWKVSTIPNFVYEGSKGVTVDREQIGLGNSEQDYLVTPAITVVANQQLKFWTKQFSFGNQGATFEIQISTNADASVLSSYTVLQTWTEEELNAVYNVWEEKVVNIPASYLGQVVHLAFVRKVTQEGVAPSGDRWIVDKVNVVQKCLEPTEVTSSNQDVTTMSLNWKDIPGDAWDVAYFPQGTTTFDGTPTLSNITLANTPNLAEETANNYELDLTNLTPDTIYEYWVRTSCSTDNKSIWVGPKIFITLPYGSTCNGAIQVASLPYQTSANTGNYSDLVDVAQGTGCGATPAGTNYMDGNEVFYTYTPTTSGMISVKLTPTGPNSSVFIYQGCPVGGNCLGGAASTNSNVRFIDNFAVTANTPYTIVVSSSAATQTVGYTLVIQQENCDPPVGQATTGLTLHEATLNWTNPTVSTSWEVSIQDLGAGIPQGVGVTVTGGLPTYHATDLIEGHQYQYWVRAECSPGIFSAWAGPYPFNTVICEDVNKCNYTFRMTDSANNGWQGAKMQVRQNNIVIAEIGPTYTTGAGPVDVVVGLCHNVPFDLYWSVAGSAPQQCKVAVINSFGQTLYTKNNGVSGVGQVVYSDIVDCLVPRCNIPPVNVTAQVPTITTSSATVQWVAPATTSWDIYIVQAGYPSPDISTANGTLISGVTSTTNPPSYNLTSLLADTTYNVYIKVVCGSASDWSLPGIFTTLPTCFKPTTFAVVPTSITTTSAKFNWTNGSATDTKWEILCVPTLTYTLPTILPPVNPSYSGQVLQAFEAPITLPAEVTGLSPATIYYYYIRTICSTTDQSTWAGPFVFNTVTCEPAAKCNYKFMLTNTTGNSWNGGRMQVRQNGILIQTLGSTNSQINSAAGVLVPICPGIPFDLYWSVAGTIPEDIGVTIVSPFDDVIYTKSPGQGAEFDVLYNSVGNCTPAACSKPTGMAAVPSATSAILSWTDNSTPPASLYDLYVVPTGDPAPTNDPVTTPTISGVSNNYVITYLNQATSLPLLTPSTSYTYYVRTSCGGGIYSTWTILKPMTFITTPVNDECVNATSVTVNTGQECLTVNNATGNTYGATASLPLLTPPLTGTGCGQTNKDVWYKFVATATSQSITISNIVTSPLTALNVVLNHSVFSGTCDALTKLYCSTNNSSDATGLVIGQTYYIRVYNANATPTSFATFDLCITSPPVNDDCNNATSVTVNAGQECLTVNTVTGNTNGAIASLPILTPPLAGAGCGQSNKDVWYKFVATSTSQTINISNVISTPSSANIVLNHSVFSGTCDNLTKLYCSTNYNSDATGLTIGGTYYIRVYAANNVVGQSAIFDLCITSPPANDECINAKSVTVNSGQDCLNENKVLGNTIGSTASLPILSPALTGAACGQANKDVWFKFIALATSQMIGISNVIPTPSTANIVLNHSVFSGECNNLTKLYCSTSGISEATGLVVGNTYYIRIYASNVVAGQSATFDLCITSPPVNDDCINATNVIVNTGQDCVAVNTVAGNTFGATASLPILTPPLTGAGCGQANRDVWYKFTATHVSQTISLTNVISSPATPVAILNHSVFSGNCSNLTKLYCSTASSSNATGLIVGETYYVRVYIATTVAGQSATFNLCITSPPVNDDCDNAIVAPVNQTYSCDQFVYGNTLGATQSLPNITGPGCGTTDDDVWFKFTATNNVHFITLDLVSSNSTNLTINHSLFSGSCGSLTNVYCSTSNSSVATGLVLGQVYYVRVYSSGNAPGESGVFKLCVKNPPLPATNDECSTAINVPINLGSACILTTPGNIIGATASSVPNSAPNCQGNANDDVWFTFTADSDIHFISLLNVEGSTTNLNYAVYSGVCGSLTKLYCSAANELSTTYDSYIAGETYYIRVWSNQSTSQMTAFDVCVKSVSTCENAEPFCGSGPSNSLIFENTTGIDSAGHIACLFTTPNPTYFFLQVNQTGALTYQIRQSTDPNNFPTTGAPGLDVDYVCWGPFSTPQSCTEIETNCTCGNNQASGGTTVYPIGNIVDCSYSGNPMETLSIPNAQAGEYYLLLITNFQDDPGYIKLFQTNYGTPGAGVNTNLCCEVALGDDKIECGNSVELNALEAVLSSSSTPDSFIWYFNDSLIPNASSSTYSATQSGVYKVQGTCGLNSISDEINVTLYPPVQPTIPQDYIKCDIDGTVDTTVDGKSTFDLTTLSSEVLGTLDPSLYSVTYHLSQADADADIEITSPSAFINTTPNEQIVYVKVRTLALLTCYGVVQAKLIVQTLPIAEFDYSATEFCINGVNPLPIFTNGVAGIFTSEPNGLILDSTTGEISLSTSTPGIYLVTNTISASGACQMVKNDFQVTITAPSTAAFNYSQIDYCKDAGTVTPNFVGSSIAGLFTVDPAIGLTIDPLTGVITLATSSVGTYKVINTISPSGGCSGDSQYFIINVNAPITGSITYNDPYCKSDTVVKNVLNTAPLGGIFTSTSGLDLDSVTGAIMPASSDAGDYIVKYTIPAANGCGEFITENEVTIIQEVFALFDLRCDGNKFKIFVSPKNSSFNPATSTYEWKNPSGQVISTDSFCVANVTGTYTCKITSSDGCYSIENAEVISINCDIQQGISPKGVGSGDGLNDSFDLSTLNVSKLEIFNRYGSKVYTKDNYTNEWYGQSDAGNELPDGTYYYVIEIVNDDPKTGWIYINREQ